MGNLNETTNGINDEAIDFKPDICTILGSNHDAIYYADSNGVTRKVGGLCHEFLGLESEDLIGKSVFDLERAGIYKPSITRMVLETGERIQSLQVTRTGRKLLVVGIPIKNGSGDILRVVSVSWNITMNPPGEKSESNISRLFSIYDRAMEDIVFGGGRLVYVSDSMARVADTALKVSKVDSTVFITGESGTGKEVISSYIHSHSGRSSKPFVKVNCAAIPEQLLESELFGYEKGAFTGANREGKPGLFELAENGTLFLDEISEMSPKMQAKLLRVLQDGTFTRVGGVKDVTADVRIIAATNRKLETEMREGRFRHDLFYRLNVVPIYIPPLRERTEDIPPLALLFLKYYNERYKKNKIFDAETIMRCQEHTWHGNVRELQNVIERLVVLTDEDLITSTDHDIFGAFGAIGEEAEEGVTVNRIMTLKDAMHSVERQLISMTVKKFGNATKAAEVLGVDQSTISRKLKKIDNIKLKPNEH